MAEPLVIQFAADTSRAQSAMASLAASIAGNMASAGVALSGLAANSNSTGNALGSLQQNLTRAAGAIGNDVKNIANATANAATAQKATLQGVVTEFTKAAATSQTAQAGVQAGIAGTTTAVSALGAQIPALRGVLGAFIAFEAAKLVFGSVSASIDAAREHIQEFVKIGKDAEKAGVNPEFFQRVTLGAEKYGLTVDQAAAALNRFRDASDAKIGEGKDGRNTSALSDRLQQNVLAGNVSAADRQAVEGANGTEAKLRALLDLIQKLKDEGKDLAAFDLAGKFVGPEFERQLRNGEDAVTKLKDAMNTTSASVAGIRIVGENEIERAQQLDERAKEIANTLASAWAPIQKDISASVLDTYEAFLAVESAIVRVVQVAANLYTQITSVVGAARELVSSIPYVGKVLAAGNMFTFAGEYVSAVKKGLQSAGVLGPDAPKADAETTLPEIAKTGRSKALPSLGGRAAKGGGSPATESLDGVETLINQIEKARDTAKAELENVGNTNVEREKAVALAKAEAAAREDVQKGKRTNAELDDDERKRILGAAEAWQTYKDRAMDANQAIRQNAEAMRYFGDAASNGLADAILQGKSFSSVLNGIASQIFRSGLQAAFTGQGPLAGILGTSVAASAPAGTVGGIAGLFSSFFGGFKASGGPVEAGMAYTVGERGREMFVPNQNGQIVPIAAGSGLSSSGTSIRMGDTIIDARGADAGVEQRLRALVAAQAAETRRTVGQQFAGWKENH